ncbi:rho guanine nucleotide exchange factor 11 isoform X2 [Pseudophryne corroboree]|uniref:rho guanine nucleotide exchange factor 11 isoform X2 n=1 Tax=Pseudophryne corroboree TaxID=495146 RepID=UPI0030816F15
MSISSPPTAIDRAPSKRHSHLPRLSSLSSVGDGASERRSPGHQRQTSDYNESTGLVQRCVVVQRDQNGFGFTVSGDRIVLVQSVRPGGAAMRAGVQEGDRIVKVNGTLVANSSHIEVVKLIKSGTYVALTLLGSPPPSMAMSGLHHDLSSSASPRNTLSSPVPPPPPLPPPQRITGPKPLQDPEVQKHATQILRNMLKQEETELQTLCEVYNRTPNASLQEQIEGARRRVYQLQLKIRQETSGPGDILRSYSDCSSIVYKVVEGRLSLDSQDGDSGLDSGTERIPSLSEYSMNRNSVLSDLGLDSSHTSPVISTRIFQHRRQGSDTALVPGTEQVDNSRPPIIGPEEDYDHGYDITECDGLFQDLEKLKGRPAHMGVFLRYIFSQADPNPLLFYLCAEVCQQLTARDSCTLGKEVWSIFLDKTAPLRVKIPESLLSEIESRIRSSEDIRSALSEAQEAMLPEIQEQIQDYRTKRTMGLGSLYGENDLLDLDIDPQRERQVAAKQIAQLGEILSKYEEERSSPMAFALSTYMNHAGISSREFRPVSVSEKSQSILDKEKWLPFFPKTKKNSNAKKDKDREQAEDKRRNPILKYIGKPKSSSQSTFHIPLSPGEVKPGNVRNIIQHFENNQQYDFQELGLQRLSTGSYPEDLLDNDSARAEVKLGRSESLKGREELKKSRKVDNVPRSRSDVDMDAAAEAARLHQSASSSASSLSTRSLDNPTPPYTPKLCRRSMESPNLSFTGESLLANLQEDDLGHLSDLDPEPDAQNWQHTVGREVAQNLHAKERARQEVIHELFMTEASHLRVLRVLDHIFYQRMRKENLLSTDELLLVFPNLPELIEIHNSLAELMKRVREEGPIVKEIGDLMLSRFDGTAGEEVCQETAKFCSCQTIALDLIKIKKRKETRFNLFMQEAESSPQCRRLQLKDLIVSEMQRLTKYPLLLENIIKHTHAGTAEYEKLCYCRDRCRDILKYVNESVKQRENEYRLAEYQKRLDTTSLERSNNPLAAEFKNLDLTSRRMIHEGSLTWRITKDKTIDLHVLLLEDLLVLLQKQDEKLVLKCHSKTTVVSSDTKQTFSPVIKLNSVLVRSVATDKKAFFIICTSELGPQIYELVALTSSEKNMWKDLLEEATKGTMRHPPTSIKPGTQDLAPSRTHSSSSVFQDACIPAILCEAGMRTNSEDLTIDESHSDYLGHSHKPEVLLEEPEGLEEDEAQTPTQLPFPSKVEDAGGGSEDQADPSYLPFRWPSMTEGLAESALEDVQNLRQLILQSLLPLRQSEYDSAPVAEPEDDLTPTPSVTGGAGQPWEVPTDTLLETLDGESMADNRGGLPSQFPSMDGSNRSVVDLTHNHRRTSVDGEERVWSQVEGHSHTQSEPSAAASEEESNQAYRVVRKAEVVGSNDVIPLPDIGQADRVLREAGGGTGLDGNLFYVVMPSVPTLPPPEDEHRETPEPRRCREPVGSPTLPKSQDVHSTQTSRSQGHSPPARRPESPAPHPDLPPNLVIQDVDTIFRTMEQLTAKLHRLQEVESAHQELLRSLRSKTTEEQPCQPEPTSEVKKQPEIQHGSSVNSSSLFFVKNSMSVSLHRDSLTDPPDGALNFTLGL